jgi:DNA-binding MarR family transcriptional regulator
MARTSAPARPAVEVVRVAADLNVALGRVVRRLRQAHAPGDLTLSEASVLARLDRESPADRPGMTPGELATGERVKPQAMCTTLAALERRDLVSRTADPFDGRRALMAITEGGRAVLGHRRGAKTAGMAEALSAGFTASERAQLAAATLLLDRLADLL